MLKISSSLFPVILISLVSPLASCAQNAAQPAAAVAESAPPARDWTTWGYDQERSGWNRGETLLTKDNVSKLGVRWSTQLSTPVTDTALSTLTAPLVVEGVSTAQGAKNLVFVLGADDTLFAIDANTGKVLRQKTFTNPIKPLRAANWLCPNTPNDTPVIDKARGIIFFITSDGKLRGLNLSDGAERMPPTDMVAPFARAWSLNLINNVVYTTSGRACGEVVDPNSAMAAAISPVTRNRPAGMPGGPPPTGRGATGALRGPVAPVDPSAVSAMDVSDLGHPSLTRFYLSGGRPAAPWGRGGLAKGPNNSLILETSDGLFDPGAGNYGDTVLKLAPKATRELDSFTPKNHHYLLTKDLAGSTTPVVFSFANKTLIAVSQKEAVLYLLDAADLGGGFEENHSTPLYQAPQLGNDAALGTDPSQGVWGAMATYETPAGKRFLYVPMWGPPSKNEPPFKSNNGPIPTGSIMAFQVTGDGGKISLDPQWSSPDMIMPDPPVVANGVVYATSTGGQALQNPRNPDGSRYDGATTGAHYRSTPVSNLVLYAFDADTGKQLYSSEKTITDWVHFSEPVVALGKVFLVTHDAHVYAFDVKQ